MDAPDWTYFTSPTIGYIITSLKNHIVWDGKQLNAWLTIETMKRKQCCSQLYRFSYMYIFIDRVAGAIIRLVASVCVSVRLSVGALLFEPFDL